MPSGDFKSLFAENSHIPGRSQLKEGGVIEAEVVLIGGEFVFLDVGALPEARIPREQLLASTGDLRVKVGDRIRAVVVSNDAEGPLLRPLAERTSPKALVAPEPLDPEEVLKARVSKVIGAGVIVQTPRGEGLVPLRELELPPHADHRRLYPVGREFDVVLLRQNPDGRLAFSTRAVAAVEEKRNYREFAAAQPAAEASHVGSFGQLLRKTLSLPEPPPGEPASAAPFAPAPTPTQANTAQAARPAPSHSAPRRAEPRRDAHEEALRTETLAARGVRKRER